MTADADKQKHAAALAALEHVRPGMAVGLGTGSTATHAIRELGERVRQGLSITGVPTSDSTAALARKLGITLTTLEDCPKLDITIDGADEIVPGTLDAIKGKGGALLREKIVALASDLLLLIVDESKLVERLGERTAVPVEVVTFGWTRTAGALRLLGGEPVMRKDKSDKPYLTDSGNYLLDCRFPPTADPGSLAHEIKQITGVVEHGLFVGIAGMVIIAGQNGVHTLGRGEQTTPSRG